jgi:hypothetical protein
MLGGAERVKLDTAIAVVFITMLAALLVAGKIIEVRHGY